MPSRMIYSAALLPLLVVSLPVEAEDNTALLSRIEKLEAELSLLRRQVEVDKTPAAAASSNTAPSTAKLELGSKGLRIESPDKHYTLSLRGTVQMDGRMFLDDEAGTGRDEWLARRIRPVLEGTAWKDASFRLMPDFAGSSTRVFDAHVDYRLTDALRFRLGKFKPPISLERLQSPADLMFVERGHPTSLAPSRDVGLQLYGELLPKTVEYQLGIFNGNPDFANSDSDDDDKKDVVARIFVHPFHHMDDSALQGLGVGMAGGTGDREGSATRTILGDYRTPGQQAFFRYRTGDSSNTTYASGTHWRLYPQAYWYHDNLGVMAEYAISSQSVRYGTETEELEHRAWQLATSWVMTGEDVNYRGGVSPKRPFGLDEGGWGAWEVVARVGATDMDDDAFPIYADASTSASKAETLGAGINWYLNDNFKLWANYEITRFEAGASNGGDRPDEHAVLTRAQYRF